MNNVLKIFPILLCAVMMTLQLNAQDETLFEKIDVKITGAWGGPHTIFSGFQEDNSFSTGGFGGIEFSKVIFIGWGSYDLQTKLQIEGEASKNYELNYHGPHLAYTYNPSMVVHPTVSIMLGPGTTKVDDVKDDNVFIFQPSLGAEINIFKWFRVNLRGGYRSVLDSDSSAQISNEDLSSFFGGIDFKFGWSWGAEADKEKL